MDQGDEMRTEVERRGRRIVNVRGDGNCLYRAIGRQLNERYDVVR